MPLLDTENKKITRKMDYNKVAPGFWENRQRNKLFFCEKIKFIKDRIRKNCSPKHVPSLIIKVPAIPRTKSGKIVELAVRKIIHGEPINNKEAIANPEVLKYFENMPQLKL